MIMKIAPYNTNNYYKRNNYVSFGSNDRTLVFKNHSNVKSIFKKESIPAHPEEIKEDVKNISDSYLEKMQKIQEEIDITCKKNDLAAGLIRKYGEDGKNEKYFRFLDKILLKDYELLKKYCSPAELNLIDAFKAIEKNTNIGLVCKAEWDNSVMIVSKDPHIAEKFIDLAALWIRLCPSKWCEIDRGFNFEYKKLMPNKNNEELQEALGEALEKAKEQYEKGGKETLLFVPDMERLCDRKRNSVGNIACMKEMMNQAGQEYHTTIIFSAQDPSKLEPGTMVSHRVGYQVKLLDDTVLDDFTMIESSLKDLQPYVEERIKMVDEYYEKTIPLAKKIKALQEKCKSKIEELINNFKNGKYIPKSLQDPPKEITEAADEPIEKAVETKTQINPKIETKNIKKMTGKKLPILFVISGVLTYFGFTLYKKTKSKKY